MKKTTYSFNRIPFRGGLPFRKYEIPRGFAYRVDGSALPYFVEELIACSALEVAIPSHHHAAAFVDDLAAALKNRVALVDPGRAVSQRDALLAPVLSEFGVAQKGPALEFSSPKAPAIESVLQVFYDVETLLLGMDAGLEIDLDLERLVGAVRLLRSRSSSSSARANLAVLEGILNSYVASEVPSLVAIPRAGAELVEVFSELVEDESYRRMAASANGLGIPDQVRSSIERMRRHGRSVLRKTGFKKLFNFGAKAVSIAATVPVPDSEVAEVLLQGNYLPPIVTTSALRRDAIASWRRDNPDVNDAMVPGG